MASFIEKWRQQQGEIASGKRTSVTTGIAPVYSSSLLKKYSVAAPKETPSYTAGQNIARYSLNAIGALGKVLTAGQAGLQVISGQIGGAISALSPSLRREIGDGSALQAYKKTSQAAMEIAKQTMATGSYSQAMRQSGAQLIPDKYSRSTTATDIIIDLALDPFTYVGAGVISKPLKAAATATKLVAEGEKVVGTVKTGIRAASTALERKAVSKLAEGITSGTTKAIVEDVGSLAAFANRNAEIIKKIYGITKLGRKEVGMVDEAVGLVNKEFVSKLKGAGEMDRFADNVQRNIIAEGKRVTPETVREEVVRVMRSSEMLNKTPDEMLKQFKDYTKLDIALGKSEAGKGFALAKDSNKTAAVDLKLIKEEIEKSGKYEYSIGAGPLRKTYVITEKNIGEIEKIAEEAANANYKLVFIPNKPNALEPTTRSFTQEGFVRTRESRFMPQATKLPATKLGKFLTGSRITESQMSAAIENNTFNKLTAEFGSDKARMAMAEMKNLIMERNQALADAKGVDIIKLLTLGEGIAGPSRYMDLIFADIAKVAKLMGMDANQLWRATKSGFMLDWSLAGVQNIGAFLRSRSKIVDYISRLKNELKFNYSPVFHAQQHTEVAFMNLLLGKSKVADDDLLKYFSNNFDVIYKEGDTAIQGKAKDFVMEAVEDVRTRSYDRKYIEKQGNHFFEEIFNREMQGTGIKDWKTSKKELEDIFEGRQKAIPKYNAEGDFTGFDLVKSGGKRDRADFIGEVAEYAKERKLNFTQAFLDLHPEAQPIISAMQNAMQTSEMMMRGMTQMSYIRGGLERSANYIFFPTSYVVRAVKTLANIASRPSGYATLKTINMAKNEASEYLRNTYGEEAELMPNVAWMIEQFIPLGLDNVGASMDPLARYVMANLGLGKYVKAPKSLAKSYVPIYRNALEFNEAMGEIIESIKSGEMKVADYSKTKGTKIIMDKAMYDFVTQPIPFNIKKLEVTPSMIERAKKVKKVGKTINKPTPVSRVSNTDRLQRTEELTKKILNR